MAGEQAVPVDAVFMALSADVWREIMAHISLRDCLALVSTCKHMATLFDTGDCRTLEHVCREHAVRRLVPNGDGCDAVINARFVEELKVSFFGSRQETRPWKAMCMLINALGDETLRQIIRGDGSALYVRIPSYSDPTEETGIQLVDRGAGYRGEEWSSLWRGQVADVRLARSRKVFVAFGQFFGGNPPQRDMLGGVAPMLVLRPRLPEGARELQWDGWHFREPIYQFTEMATRLLKEHNFHSFLQNLYPVERDAATDDLDLSHIEEDDCFEVRWAKLEATDASSELPVSDIRVERSGIHLHTLSRQPGMRFLHSSLLVDSSSPEAGVSQSWERWDVRILRERKDFHCLYAGHGIESIRVSIHSGLHRSRLRSFADGSAEECLEQLRILAGANNASTWLRGTKLTGDKNVPCTRVSFLANLDVNFPVGAQGGVFEGYQIEFFDRPDAGDGPLIGRRYSLSGVHLHTLYSHYYPGVGVLNREEGVFRPEHCELRLLVNYDPFRMATLWSLDGELWAAFVLHSGPF